MDANFQIVFIKIWKSVILESKQANFEDLDYPLATQKQYKQQVLFNKHLKCW